MPRLDFKSPRLFVDAPLAAGASVALDRDQANYLGNVLRLGSGARILAFNGRDGEWDAEIAGRKRPDSLDAFDLYLQALPKVAGGSPQGLAEAIELLDRAVALVKPGGRIAYVTCSVLPAENNEQVRAFFVRHPAFSVVPPEQTASVLWDKAEDFAAAARRSDEGWLMTPRRTGTDGFFVSVLRKG